MTPPSLFPSLNDADVSDDDVKASVALFAISGSLTSKPSDEGVLDADMV